MATTPSVLVAGQVMTGAVVTYYTAPAAVRVRVTNATVTNTTAGGLPLTIHRIASGGAASVEVGAEGPSASVKFLAAPSGDANSAGAVS